MKGMKRLFGLKIKPTYDMKKLILLLFIPLVFTCSSNNFLENNENIVFINDEQNVIYFKDSNNYLNHINDYDSGCLYFSSTLDKGDIDLSCYNDGVFLTDEMICKIVANESSLLVEECLWCGENEKEKLIYKYSKVSDDILILEVTTEILGGSPIEIDSITYRRTNKSIESFKSKLCEEDLKEFKKNISSIDSANDDELTSSSSNSKVKSKKITFNQAEAFMLERCERINQTLMKKKSVSFDGTKIYMFLSVDENGYVCISSISENALELLGADCGTSDRKIQEWNAVN